MRTDRDPTQGPVIPRGRRPGGRTARTQQAVLDATRELLVAKGAAGMRMDAIATRSGIHRSSIYRRWKNPAGIVADLAADFAAYTQSPDTGNLAGDLRVIAERLAINLQGDGAALVKALLGWPDIEVQAHLASFWRDRQDEVAHVLARHHCDSDPAQVTRLLVGPLHYQALIEGTPPSPDTVTSAVNAAITATTPNG